MLGPVEMWAAGRRMDTGQPRQRTVLAALLVEVGHQVTPETLVDRVWGNAPPAGARRSLHAHITRLRRMLEQLESPSIPLVYRAGGYLLDINPDLVDLHRYRRLVVEAHGAGPPVEGLRAARALWRGEPLAGLPGEWAARTRDALRQQHLDTAISWARAELRIGNPGGAIGPLIELVGEYPLVEPLAAVLLQALHAAGRLADALQRYATIRRRLVDELGSDPGPELRAVHRAILRGEPAVAGPPPAVDGHPIRPVPVQLPANAASFIGRTDELASLTAAVTDRSDTRTILAIGGAGGVGKTWLAVHWGHEHRHRFPDGQLFINLRGSDLSGQPMLPETALRVFLDALGVPPHGIPSDVDAQVGLYRSLVAMRRMLIVLDNARDADQVSGLLPGSTTSTVIVTSRDRLTGLIITHGAHPVWLDVLDGGDARLLLERRLGEQRLAAEPAAVSDIIDACEGLPLALGVAAARATVQPHLPMAAIARELGDQTTASASISTRNAGWMSPLTWTSELAGDADGSRYSSRTWRNTARSSRSVR
jgi:DNA-binding SARP family transcriptional activator